ncbi:MAG: HD domain-containing protein [Nanoarchaeota archaeon]
MLTEDEAMALMRKYAPNDHLFRVITDHTKAVRKVAMRIAKRFPRADKNLVSIGALTHDIGRFKTRNAIEHGIIGAAIMRKEGHPELASVCERHLGGGIPKDEVIRQNLPLPLKEYMPITIEEKIITAADNLVMGAKEITVAQAVDRYRREFGDRVGSRVHALFIELNQKE